MPLCLAVRNDERSSAAAQYAHTTHAGEFTQQQHLSIFLSCCKTHISLTAVQGQVVMLTGSYWDARTGVDLR